jgi:phosphoribosylanthranilate isomerase
MTKIKICGITDSENLRAALDAGAKYIGFVFYKNSPRNIEPQAAWKLSREIPDDVTTVGLFVNPTDKELNTVLSSVKLDLIQLHGDETPMRIIEIKASYNIPVMKAIRIAGQNDLENISKFEKAADWLLFDAKIEGEQGGTGKSFDWNLLRERTFFKPWMLSGGLNAGNVAQALNILHPDAVDVSSGVEKEHGIKDPAKIRIFIDIVKDI